MENSLSQLDGRILVVGLIGIIIGWILRWIISRRGTNQLLAHTAAEVEAKAANIEALRHDLSLRDRTIGEQKESLSEIGAERANLDKKIQTQAADINDLTAKMDLLDSSQSESGESLGILEDTVAALEEKLSCEEISHEKLLAEKQQEISGLQSNEHALARQSQEHEQMVKRLSVELENANEELQKQRLESVEKIASHEKHTAPLRQIQDELAQLTQLRETDRGDLSNLRSSLSVWQSRATKAESGLDQLRKTHKELQIRQANLAKPNQSYEKLIALKENEITEQKKQTHLAQSRLLTVRDEIIARDNEIAQLKETADNQQVQNRRELLSVSRKLDEQKLSAQTLADEFTAKNNQLQEKLNRLTGDNTAFSRQVLDANANSEKLKAENKSLLSDIAGLNEQTRISQVEMNTLVKNNERLETQIEKARQEAETNQRSAQQTARELQAKINASGAMRMEIENFKSTKQELERALLACQSQLQVQPKHQASNNEAPKLHAEKPDQVDDLKRISGIGPALEKMLNNLGIYHFAQLAALNDKEVAWVDEHIESFKGRIYRDEWVKQAQSLI